MVHKYVYKLDIENHNQQKDNDSIPMALDLNKDMHDLLLKQKEKISKYYVEKLWDKYKKFANDYELVFTTRFPSLSEYQPVSRSYFKLLEMLNDFEEITQIKTRTRVRSVFLCDSPGSFVELYCNYRNVKIIDKIYAISLKPTESDKSIPPWKLPQNILKMHNIKFLYGADGTGNICNIDNIDNFVGNISKHSIDFCTCDGGMDFSNDFNHQEEASSILIASEIFTVLNVQAEDGVCVLKVYDILESATISLINILTYFYKESYITKPLTSRPANSEKYIFCSGFQKSKLESNLYLIYNLRNCIQKNTLEGLIQSYNIGFLYDIVNYNTLFVINQILSITKTLLFIDDPDESKFKRHLHRQLEKGLKFCYKYGIKVSKKALLEYKNIYK